MIQTTEDTEGDGEIQKQIIRRERRKTQKNSKFLFLILRLLRSLRIILLSGVCFFFGTVLASAQPRIVVIQCDGLRWDDLQNPVCADVAAWAEQGAVGLLNTAAKDGRDVSRKGLIGAAPTVQTVSIALERADPAHPGTMIDDPLANYQAALAHEEADLILIRLNGLRRPGERTAALRRLNILTALLMKSPADRPTDFLLVSADAFGTLNPLLASGPDFPPGLLVSATTRTPGLVANLDLAPTVCALLNLPAPAKSTGRPIRVVHGPKEGTERVAYAARMVYVAELNGKALRSVGPLIFAVCAVLVVSGLMVRKRRPKLARYFAPAFVVSQNVGAAMLLAPLLVPPTLWEYGLRIAAWMTGLTVGCYILARLTRVPPPVLAAFFTVALVAGDTLAGQPLLKESLLSDYTLAGIRYYGVGNEYLGIVLGVVLAGSFAWLDALGVPFPPDAAAQGLRRGLLFCWTALLILLGWPGLGANAGSLVVTGAGFGIGAALLFGRRPTGRLSILCALGGLLLAFVFSALDAHFSHGSASHLGTALQAASGERGAAYPVAIALRKIAMNFRLLFSFWFLLGAGIVAATIFLSRRFLQTEVEKAVARYTWLAQSRKALLAAGIVSLLFKDSGVVTTLFLIGSAWLLIFWYVVAETD